MSAAPDERLRLRPDCGSCAGLCCVALPFARSADFAIDKPGGTPCPHLSDDDRCAIHAGLRDAGFPGCTVFDCLGAGQQVTQVTFRGASWRDGPATSGPMFAAFETMRALYELRWYLAEASSRTVDATPSDTAGGESAETLALEVRRLTEQDGDDLRRTDLDALRAEVSASLLTVSAAARRDDDGPDLSRRDLVGADLRGRDLRGASLRGALLIGADLRDLDLTRADLLGADLRGADLRGADLADALFVLPPQVAAARGDAATRLPRPVARPRHW